MGGKFTEPIYQSHDRYNSSSYDGDQLELRTDIRAVKVLSTINVVSSQEHSAILRDDVVGPNADGSYKWAIETDEGIFHEQRGSLRGDAGLLVEGQYQYIAPDGQVINVLYKADENGFQAKGDHIPTPPPIPPAIQRALAYLATLPPSTE